MTEICKDKRRWLRLFCSAALFFLVSMPCRRLFELVPGVTEIRPANMLAPVLGLLWGPWGAVGAALGNLLADCVGNTPWYICLPGLGINCIYGLFPWFFRTRLRMSIYMENGASILRFILLMCADSLLVTILLTLVFTAAGGAEPEEIFGLLFFNNFDFAVILGVPVLALAGSRREGQKRHRLKARFTRGFLGLCGFFTLLVLIFAYEGMRDMAALERWNRMYLMGGLCIHGVFLLTLGFMRYMERQVAEPLEQISEGAEAFSREAAKGQEELYLGLPDFSGIRTGDEVESLARSVSSMMEHICTYIKTLRSVTAERERIRAELWAAAGIQKNMVPKGPLYIGAEGQGAVWGFMEPAREVGGDFYDYFMVDEEHCALVIGDVSGKGISAALFMGMIQTLIRTRLQAGLGPARTLSEVNETLAQSNDSLMFATVWAGILECSTGRCFWASAGHNPPLTGPSGEMGFLEPEEDSGLVLAGWPGAEYREQSFYLKPGEWLCLYTDGVTEAENETGGFFGEGRLKEEMNRQRGRGMERLTQVREKIRSFAGQKEQSDDITMVLIQYMGPPDYALTSALKEAEPELYQSYLDGAAAASLMLDRYEGIFPDFTDHGCVHSIHIMELAARLAGKELYRLNGGSLYVLLEGILFHDLGMGISEKDVRELGPEVWPGEECETEGLADRIREHHQELSALLIEKYGGFLEIPPEYRWAVAQAAKGHRRADLMDEKEFPARYQIRGEEICLPYICALIRLADELDLCWDRSSRLGRGERAVDDPYSRLVWRTHDTVSEVRILEDEIQLVWKGGDQEIRRELEGWAEKLQRVSDEVCLAAEERTDFVIPARQVTILRVTSAIQD